MTRSVRDVRMSYDQSLAVSSAEEGELVEIDGKCAGVYRDERGRIGAVSAVCSHMGCPLGWNPVDRTWDCSCHGSRFAADGAVLHGPAVGPLEPVALAAELAETE